MTLIQQIDVERHFAERQASKRAAAPFASQPGATGLPGIEPARMMPDARDFTEDFFKEHSSLSVPAFSVRQSLDFAGGQAATAPESWPN